MTGWLAGSPDSQLPGIPIAPSGWLAGWLAVGWRYFLIILFGVDAGTIKQVTCPGQLRCLGQNLLSAILLFLKDLDCLNLYGGPPLPLAVRNLKR